MSELPVKLTRSTSPFPSSKSLSLKSNSDHLDDAQHVEYDPANDVNVLTRDAKESGSVKPRRGRGCRAHCARRRGVYVVLAAVLGLGLVAGVVYGVVVQIMWNRYQPAVYGRAQNLTGTQQIWAHSHNDELQDEPLTLALRLGFSSIEIDTWYISPLPNSFTNKSYLSIGHDEQYIRNGTLVEVYLFPILQLLDTLNPERNSTNISTSLVSPTPPPPTPWKGLHPTNSSTVTQLVFDFKNAPEASYSALDWDLRRLRDKGYLTTYDTISKVWTYGPLQIVITGDGPLPAVYHATSRSIFYDAPLLSLSTPFSIPLSPWGPAVDGVEWTKEVAPMASAKIPIYAQCAPVLPPPPHSPVVGRLGRYAAEADKRGIRARWWGAARGTRETRWVRERLWSVVKESGAGWVGGDDLEEMAAYLKEYAE